MLMMNLKNDECKCHLLNVLYVLSMAYNLWSVSKAAENRKKTVIKESDYEIINKKMFVL